MAKNNEDDIMKDLVEVEIPADEMQLGFEPDGMPKAEPVKRQEAKSVDDAVEVLKRDNASKEAALTVERQAREDAERRANENATRALGADEHAARATYQLIANGITSTEAAIEAAMRDFAAALEGGNHADAALAQRRIAQAETKLSRLMDGKDELDARIAAQKHEAEVRKTEVKREPEKVSDPVDTYISGFPKVSAEWLRDHREYVTDQKLNHRMIAASHEAQAEGITLHTPEHIAYIERKLGLANDGEGEGEVEVDTTPARAEPARRPTVAAPVSRDSSRSLSNPSKVRLTPDEVDMAAALGMTTVDYAKYKIGAERAGMYTRNS